MGNLAKTDFVEYEICQKRIFSKTEFVENEISRKLSSLKYRSSKYHMAQSNTIEESV